MVYKIFERNKKETRKKQERNKKGTRKEHRRSENKTINGLYINFIVITEKFLNLYQIISIR
jgi:hypothetical protein